MVRSTSTACVWPIRRASSQPRRCPKRQPTWRSGRRATCSWWPATRSTSPSRRSRVGTFSPPPTPPRASARPRLLGAAGRGRNLRGGRGRAARPLPPLQGNSPPPGPRRRKEPPPPAGPGAEGGKENKKGGGGGGGVFPTELL